MFSIINLSPNLFDLIRKILVLPSNSLKNVKIWILTIHHAGASMAACSEPGYSHLLAYCFSALWASQESGFAHLAHVVRHLAEFADFVNEKNYKRFSTKSAIWRYDWPPGKLIWLKKSMNVWFWSYRIPPLAFTTILVEYRCSESDSTIGWPRTGSTRTTMPRRPAEAGNKTVRATSDHFFYSFIVDEMW